MSAKIKPKSIVAGRGAKMPTSAELTKIVQAHGKTYELKIGKLTRLEIDTEHYYYLGRIGFLMGVTTILDRGGPVPAGLKRFFQQNTPEEQEEIRSAAAGFGSKMHNAFEMLLYGAELNLLEHYPTTREKRAVTIFMKWFNAVEPRSFRQEMVVASKKFRYAGTLDFVGYIRRDRIALVMFPEGTTGYVAKRKAFIDGEPEKEDLWIIDFKTSSGIHYNMELQVAAYKQAIEESYGLKVEKTGILRLPTIHKQGFEFKETKRDIKDFMRVYQTFLDLHGGKVPEPPEIVEYPDRVQLLTETKENNANIT